MKYIINKNITHQGIGGQPFHIDEFISKDLTLDSVLEQATAGNIACINFLTRRMDDIVISDFPHKLYYVKINNLGYIIADDEIEKVDD